MERSVKARNKIFNVGFIANIIYKQIYQNHANNITTREETSH